VEVNKLPKRQQGISLVEVLVAVVVLSIGMLGMAGLQFNSAKMNQSAYFRTQATSLAYDLTDRMRVNRAAALNGDYDTLFDTAATGTTLCGAALNPFTAAVDIDQWKHCIELALPAGQGEVEGLVGDQFRITVRWDDSRDGSAPQAFAMETEI